MERQAIFQLKNLKSIEGQCNAIICPINMKRVRECKNLKNKKQKQKPKEGETKAQT